MNRKYTSLSYIENPVATGNFDGNRLPITKIIIHTTDGTLAGTLAWFNNPQSHVSAHYVIDTDGTIHALLEEYYIAYQAGNYAVNQCSIGIEHVDLGKPNDPRPDSLYTSSAKLVADICKFYNIPIDSEHVLPHRAITATACPDSLDVERIIRQAKALETPQTLLQSPTDQTIVHTLSDGDMEWQRARSLIEDRKKEIESLKKSIVNANIEVFNLQKELESVKELLTEYQSRAGSPVPSKVPHWIRRIFHDHI